MAIELGDLPTGPDGSDFSNLTPVQAAAMLQDAVLEAPLANVQTVITRLEAAQAEYRTHAKQRRYLLAVAQAIGAIAKAVT